MDLAEVTPYHRDGGFRELALHAHAPRDGLPEVLIAQLQLLNLKLTVRLRTGGHKSGQSASCRVPGPLMLSDTPVHCPAT